jgi:hypothetical protein
MSEILNDHLSPNRRIIVIFQIHIEMECLHYHFKAVLDQTEFIENLCSYNALWLL